MRTNTWRFCKRFFQTCCSMFQPTSNSICDSSMTVLQPFWARAKALSGRHFSKPMDPAMWFCNFGKTITRSVTSWFRFVGTAIESDVWESYSFRKRTQSHDFRLLVGMFEICLEYSITFVHPSFRAVLGSLLAVTLLRYYCKN